MGLRRRSRGRRTARARRLTLAEANLRAQVAALEPEQEPSADEAAPEVIDVAALEREQLFASHPRVEPRQDQDSGR